MKGNNDIAPLTFDMLKQAVAGHAAAIRCRSRLQPAGGEGTKVFPPTHAGGVYAMEKRRIPVRDESGKVVSTREADCVLLDSVQSQANRIEDVLQQAIDDKLIEMPLIVVDFGDRVPDVRRVTSLQAPHRAADAILRDSLANQNGTAVSFRQSEVGKAITNSSLANATPLFEHCPHALFLGVWDSTGPKGGLGAKFARALVSEIVGIDVILGKKTSSRIDPLQIRADAKVIKAADSSWKMAEESKLKGAVSPSEINHSNIPPDIADGSVTISHAEHIAVLSLPQLRRLRFPLDKPAAGRSQAEVDNAARAVLAALSLVGLTLSLERGCDLRSRCLLVLEDSVEFELLDVRQGRPSITSISLDSAQAISLYKQTVSAAKAIGLPWSVTPTQLTPSQELIALVKKSQALAAVGEAENAKGG
jgi:CRISPR-associated protein Csb1